MYKLKYHFLIDIMLMVMRCEEVVCGLWSASPFECDQWNCQFGCLRAVLINTF